MSLFGNGFLGSIIGAAGAPFTGGASLALMAGDVASSLYGNYASAKAATKSFDRDVWMMSNRYQLQTKDMIKAGLNPMLAAGASPPSPSAPMPSQTGPAFGRAAAASQAASAAEVNRATAGLIRAQTMTELNRPANVQADTGLKEANTRVENLRYSEVMATIDLIGAKAVHELAGARQADAATDLARGQLGEVSARIANLDADTAVKALDAQLKGLDISKARQILPYLVAMTKAETWSKQLSLPEAMAMAAKYRTWFGQTVLPWAQEAGKLLPGAAGAAAAGKYLLSSPSSGYSGSGNFGFGGGK